MSKARSQLQKPEDWQGNGGMGISFSGNNSFVPIPLPQYLRILQLAPRKEK